jgi:AraC-like DNA-binding protein
MAEIHHIHTVHDYTDYFGLAETNPMIGLVDLTTSKNWPDEFHLTFDVYAVLLMGTHCGEVRYGRQGKYDFDAGTIITYAPGQTINVKVFPGERPTARGILFHPDYIRGTSLADQMSRFTFFSYSSNEALYVNEYEHKQFMAGMERVRTELEHSDEFTRQIMCSQLELLFNYLTRFYARQFERRREPDHDVFVKFEKLLYDYFNADNPRILGLPTVKYFADKVFLSPNYFGDLIKTQTGNTVRSYIQKTIIGTAKERLLKSDDPVNDIALGMGFQTAQHFSTTFKKATGMTPNAYRQAEGNF